MDTEDGTPRFARLSSLVGIFVMASALGAASPGATTALTITPAAHNFGQVIVGARGKTFAFTITMAPGGKPDDLLYAVVLGPDFRTANNFVESGPCISPPLIPKCTLEVEFIPQGPGVKNSFITFADDRGNTGKATLTGTGIFGCVMYEGLCNYAANYSGSFGWRSTLTGAGGTWTKNVDVGIKDGVVVCGGQESEPDGGGGQRTGAVSGPGLLVVQFKREGSRFLYQITGACPPAFGGRPANFSRRESMDWEPASRIGIDLQDSQGGPHPDADLANGATGTMLYAWDLKRR